MKAFIFNESECWVPYDNTSDDICKFLYYSEEKIILMVSAFHPEKIAHTGLHAKSAPIIQSGHKPVGAGRFSANVVEDWESLTMDIITPEKYRIEIAEFLLR